MNRKQICITPFIVSIILFSVPMTTFAESSKGKFTVSTGATYTSGDYGGTEKTKMLYSPISLKYNRDRWKIKLTVPYIKITGPQNVIRNIGQINQMVSHQQDTSEGLGDITLASNYQLFYSPKLKTLFDVTGKVKFGTADENKNLGTGKTDYSLSFGVYKLIGNFTPYATFGRKFYGDPSGYILDDVFYGSVGLSYKLSQKTSMGVDVYLKDKTAPNRSTTRQLSAYLSHKLDKNWKLQGYLIEGLSENTPDVGGGFSLAYTFN